jgi:hypothetical protein
MNIQHHPLFNTARAEELYSKKDGIEVKYICTTDLHKSDMPMDVFYRETPHPEFGNKYFGLFRKPDAASDRTLMITNADVIESLEFGMIEIDGKYHYSQSHHDYKVIGDKMIDGGRAYIRSSGGTTSMRIKNGKFYVNNIEDIIDIYGETND